MHSPTCELVTPPDFGECAGPCVFVVLHRPEEASGSGQKFRCCLLRAWRWAEPVARLPQENQETHKPEQNPGHLSRSAFRSASLRFTTTTTTYGHRVPTELCPTGPVVFCGSASHSLPLFVCNMITHRRWCSASCLATKTHHR